MKATIIQCLTFGLSYPGKSMLSEMKDTPPFSWLHTWLCICICNLYPFDLLQAGRFLYLDILWIMLQQTWEGRYPFWYFQHFCIKYSELELYIIWQLHFFFFFLRPPLPVCLGVAFPSSSPQRLNDDISDSPVLSLFPSPWSLVVRPGKLELWRK